MAHRIQNKTANNFPLVPLDEKLLIFISETKDGKFTSQIPILSNINFRRIDIQEQDESISSESPSDDTILYGIS